MINPNKTIIIVITNLGADDLAIIAENLEHKDNILLLCDEASTEEYKPKGVSYLIDSFEDKEKILEKLRLWEEKSKKQFSGIVALDEEHHYSFSEAIAHEFSLPFYEKSTLDIASNKYLQRMKLKEAGICVPKFTIITEPIKNCQIIFPNVLKLITGYGSSLVYANHNIEELEKNIKKLKGIAEKDPNRQVFDTHYTSLYEKKVFYPKEQFILEEYIKGEEYSCDFLVEDDKASVVRVVKKITNEKNFAFFEGMILFNPKSIKNPDFSLEELQKICEKAAHAMGIDSGVCMMDFIFSNGKITVIETTIRPGISTFVDLMAHIYRSTSINKLIQQKLGLHVDTSIPEGIGLAVYFLSPRLGVLKNFDTSFLEKNKDKLGIIKIVKYYLIGERIKDEYPGQNMPALLGYALVKGVEIGLIQERINTIRNNVVLEIE